jgi:hypothetical protein
MQPSDKEALTAWESARSMQATAATLLTAPGVQDGVRLAAAKLLEVVVLLYTSDTAPSLPGMCHAQPDVQSIG